MESGERGTAIIVAKRLNCASLPRRLLWWFGQRSDVLPGWHEVAPLALKDGRHEVRCGFQFSAFLLNRAGSHNEGQSSLRDLGNTKHLTQC